MATNLTHVNGNDFENENSSAAVTVKALISSESARGTVPAVYVTAGEEYLSLSVPANCVIKNFYLVVEEAMTGTVTIVLDGDTPADIFAAATAISSVGATKSSLEDVYVTTPTNIKFVFSDTQTATDGDIKVAFDFIQLDTNTAKHVN